MKILLIWPKFPDTFWSFKYALPFIAKKAASPPLGLLTVASILPKEWKKKLVDLNVEKLRDRDILGTDFVFISAMIAQKESVQKIIKKAKKFNKKIVAGGPLFITGSEDYLKDIDHLVLGEAEITLPFFLEDLKNGNLKKIYKTDQFVDMVKSPPPLWKLIDFGKYASLSVQYSRGCPFNCEFCDVTVLYGRVQRTKDKNQVLKELDILYAGDWRGEVFFVDDNFIGNKEKLKREILPAIIKWQEKRKYPFSFNTQLSINLADDKELMKMMAEAGFIKVFVGIETVDEESLKGCGKFQNVNRNLLESVKIIQNHGLEVQGGFILGFDQDSPSIFDRITKFIQRSGICSAMVGLLGVAPKTRLYQRLKAENRLLCKPTGDNTDATLSFIPKMGAETLVAGYKKVTNTIYKPSYYYWRLIKFLKQYRPKGKIVRIDFTHFVAFLKSIWFLGIKGKERLYYWRLVFWTLINRPELFPKAIELAIYGFHFRKIFQRIA